MVTEFQSHCHGQGRLSLDWVDLSLNTSRNGAATASMGNMFQRLTNLTIKTFSLISNQPIVFKFETIPPCSVSMCSCKNPLSIFLVGSLQVLKATVK